MLNLEYYSKELIENFWCSDEGGIGIDKRTMEFTGCAGIYCENCLFYRADKKIDCAEEFQTWLSREYGEINWEAVEVGTPVICYYNEIPHRLYFAGLDDEGNILAYPNGTTSWSSEGKTIAGNWDRVELAEIDE